MSNYTKNTNFTAKDNLTSGDPAKVIKGAEFDTEFNALETAVNSKADSNNSQLTGTTNAQTVTTTGNVTVGGNLAVTGNATISGNLTFGDADTDTVSFSADVNSNIIPDADATYDLGSSTKEWRNIYVDGTAFLDTINFNGTNISATAAELNTLDGITASTAELNILDGVTSTTAEINKLDGFTGTVVDLNYAKDLRATGVTTAEFDKLDGLTASTSELNVLDGITATTTELNYTDGVTSNIQTQLNSKVNNTQSPTLTLTGDVSGSATFTNLGNASLSVTIADDSHNHTISNVDGLQSALDAKASLSGATFTGDVTVDGELVTDHATLTAIAQTKAESAVDVFVYDTSKDSDGGAWRHRTQHTSWYNETLNTATRGSRKEFPAVAVIVAESNKVTIYDGDDPSLPMWKSFSPTFLSGGQDWWRTSRAASSVTALNGFVCIGKGSGGSFDGLSYLNFPDDSAGRYYKFGNHGTISPLTAVVDTEVSGSLPEIVDTTVNDVAMTVLPDAPIDQATGLPIPTIAVATDGGVSVIKDDGTVVDITLGANFTYIRYVGFTDNNRLHFVSSYQSLANANFNHIVDIPTVDTLNAPYDNGISSLNGEFYFRKTATVTTADLFLLEPDNATGLLSAQAWAKDAISSNKGLNKLYRNEETPTEGMISYITSTYNTGWMNGDIKLATLSDTDDTDLVGSELVDDTGDLYSQFTTGEFTIGVGSASVTNLSLNDRLYIAPNGGFIPQGKYVVSFDVTVTDTGFNGLYYNGKYYISFPSVGSYSTTIDFTGTSNPFFYVSAGDTIQIDNISVRLAEPDRSVNNNGLQVFGTVQKSPVATGADLVAYSAANATSWMVQPYNSDLDFGTGDFCINVWLKDSGSGSTQYIMNRDTKLGLWRVTSSSTRALGLWVGDTNTYTTSSLPVNKWSLYTAVRKDGVLSIYIDGVLDVTLNRPEDVTSPEPLAVLAYTPSGGSACQYLDVALLRISGTAPTAEQIKKIYEDEKVLFQENAKATLHGTSDAVTALAYDDTTELLHVGTSAGRSVFQGLRRVDNTTDAVGVAISASNGLVAEE